ncbi:hypothetical protein EYF80_036545 [Liparis tanakae]|uniref:Uncharacterized protein n=1 Tax=Liparis tanakae TaxID=230148 RepID=A0A4Z2GKE7_9TELE|nr:hypothetical protein EYF80_036545 [Liparis tanakae]
MDRFALEPFVSSRYDEIETVVTSFARPRAAADLLGNEVDMKHYGRPVERVCVWQSRVVSALLTAGGCGHTVLSIWKMVDRQEAIFDTDF